MQAVYLAFPPLRICRRNMTQGACFLPRKWLFFSLLLLSVVAMMVMTISHSSSNFLRKVSLEESIAVMKTRLMFLESQYGGRKEEIYNMQSKIDGAYGMSQHVTGSEASNVTYPPITADIMEFLKEINGTRAAEAFLSPEKPEIIKTPFSLRIMTHLLDNPESLRPAYHLRSNRQFVDYIIGVPHVKRDKETYLYETLKVLLDNMTQEDMNSTLIVVMVGETDLSYVLESAVNIEHAFPNALNQGLIEVISPNKYYYPNLDELRQTLGDSMKRVKWRTKQNLDAIYLMAFAQPRCLYYLMIEDDVVAEKGFMTDIRQYTAATTVSNPDWFFIQYSTTGGIGKLFRSTDLIHFMTYVQLFYNNMPIDWLTESYLADRICGINKGSKDCGVAKSKIRPTFKKNLFKHIGLYSSLKGKIQKVKGVPVKSQLSSFFPHANPPVSKIKSDLGNYHNFTIENAYNGNSFYWGVKPKEGDVIEFWFQNPTTISRYLIRSGNPEHITDKIKEDTLLEILPMESDTEGFIQINKFDEFGMVEGHVDKKYGNLLAIRIRFTTISKYWVVINEIEFVDAKNDINTEDDDWE